MGEKNLVIYTDGGEWSALYVDGDLEIAGDTYLVEEKAFALLGVATIHCADWIGSSGKRDSIAKTIDEIKSRTAAREEREQRAAKLEEEARRLLAEASELRG